MRSGRAAVAAVAALGVAAFVVLCVADGADRPPGWVLALIALAAAIPIALGLVLAWRRPDLMVGALLAAFATVPLAEFAVHAWGATETTAHPWPGAHVAAVIDVGGWMWFFLPPAVLAAVFPGGLVLSRRGRWLLFGWPVVLVAFGFGVALDPSTYREGGGTVPCSSAHVGTRGGRDGGRVAGARRVRGVARRFRGRGPGALPPRRHPPAPADPVVGAERVPAAAGAADDLVLLPARSEVGGRGGRRRGPARRVLRHAGGDRGRRPAPRPVLHRPAAGAVRSPTRSSPPRCSSCSRRSSSRPGWCWDEVRRRRWRSRRSAARSSSPGSGGGSRPSWDRRFDRAGGQAVAEVAGFVDAVRDGQAAPEQIESALRAAVGDPEHLAGGLPAAERRRRGVLARWRRGTAFPHRRSRAGRSAPVAERWRSSDSGRVRRPGRRCWLRCSARRTSRWSWPAPGSRCGPPSPRPRRPARDSSEPGTRSAGGWSGTCTTARSSGWWHSWGVAAP